jgi:hypothetical protein
VTWAAPSAVSSCFDPACDPVQGKCYDVTVTCGGSGPNGAVSEEVATTGGVFSIGRTLLWCDASSPTCKKSDRIEWTIDVNENTMIDLEVQLEPVMLADVTRCITFHLYEDCVQDPDEVQVMLPFGGDKDFTGHYTDSFKIPYSGQWVCITAQDQQHSLRSIAYPECAADGVVYASFKGDPKYFGGNWLTQGNLDAWKKLINPDASVDKIDIYDFGQFIAQYMRFVPQSASDCIHKHEPHGDINGDGIVSDLDFAFVLRNFLQSSKDSCCPDGGTADAARSEVSVRELIEMGMRDLVAADLNGDGLVNMDDMAAFMAGERPRATKVPGRSSTLRGSK